MRGIPASHPVDLNDAAPASGAGRWRDSHSVLVVSMLTLLAIAMWAHWPTMRNLFHGLAGNGDYSAGVIVPPLAAFLIWRKRGLLRFSSWTPCWWAGIPLLLFAETCRAYGFLSALASVERYSLVLTAAGSVLVIAGWQVFRRVLWIFLFLLLMVPLPGQVHNLISPPLQNIATTGAVFLLEACGTSVSQQGNIVVLNGRTPLGVEEACDGLRMLIAFVIAAALIAQMVKRPRWQKAVVLASSIPVAVICNVIRIFFTALLMLYVGSEAWQEFFHDIGGFVMIAVAVSLLFGEIRLMDSLIVSEPNPQPGQLTAPAR